MSPRLSGLLARPALRAPALLLRIASHFSLRRGRRVAAATTTTATARIAVRPLLSLRVGPAVPRKPAVSRALPCAVYSAPVCPCRLLAPPSVRM